MLDSPNQTSAPPPSAPFQRYQKTSPFIQEYRALLWPLLALALLLAYNALCTQGFFHIETRNGHLFGSLIDILNRGAPVMLIALGMTLVIATNGIDLSVGAVVAVTGAVAAILIARPSYSTLSAINLHGSITAVILLSLFVALFAGVFNGLLVALLDIQPIVATLILMVTGRGVAQLITTGQIPTFENPAFQFLGSGFLFGLPFPVTIVALTFILTALLTRRTALGLFIESVGNNPTAASYAGINSKLVKIIVYGFCGLCAGVAGLITTADLKCADANNAGLYIELDAILAVAIGGTSLSGGRFYLVGSLLGALVIQTLTTTILTLGIDRAVTLIIEAGIVVAVCLLQSDQFRSTLLRAFRGRSK